MTRTRFAPSPTGYMHIGNLRTALYAYLLARKDDGVFILRIEDTDTAREVPGAVEAIYTGLRAAGIEWDEGPDVGGDFGPYVQTQRRELYREYAQKLIDDGAAYPCFCTAEQLQQKRDEVTAAGGVYVYDRCCRDLPKDEAAARMASEAYCVRQRVPTTGTTTYDDVLFGAITVDNDVLDDMVLLKTDGLPTYNFANVVDDHLMGITHVVRGSEYVSSTPKYCLLYQAFGWKEPVYLHVSNIMADATRKLSKRLGDPTFEELLREGYLPQAVINLVALCGWSPGDDRELFTMPELIAAFDIKGLATHSAIFDRDKLTWCNAQYIRAMSPQEFLTVAEPYLAGTAYDAMDDDLRQLLATSLIPRVEVLTQAPELVEKCVTCVEDFDPALYTHQKMKTDAAFAAAALPIALAALRDCDWNPDAMKAAVTVACEAAEIKPGRAMFCLRVALSGRESTPCGAWELALFAGREEALRRLAMQAERLAG